MTDNEKARLVSQAYQLHIMNVKDGKLTGDDVLSMAIGQAIWPEGQFEDHIKAWGEAKNPKDVETRFKAIYGIEFFSFIADAVKQLATSQPIHRPDLKTLFHEVAVWKQDFVLNDAHTKTLDKLVNRLKWAMAELQLVVSWPVYAVVSTYSFDDNVEIKLFFDQNSAANYVRDTFHAEVNEDDDMNNITNSRLDDDGLFARIINYPRDGGPAQTSKWQVIGPILVPNRLTKKEHDDQA